MASCSSCGSAIPDGQGSSCSMCYGDIAHGSDGYYEEWARQQEARQYSHSLTEEEQERVDSFIDEIQKNPLENNDLPF